MAHLDKDERKNMVGVLEWKTGWSYEAINNLDDTQLEKLWEERVDHGENKQ